MRGEEMSDSGGISFLSALGLLFIGLKLGNVITWDWIWVLAPLWIPLAIVGIVLLIASIAIVISALFHRR
jgi:hypothetical protein